MMTEPFEIESSRSLAGAVGHAFWGWEIPVYLFLGGLAAGLTITVAARLMAKGRDAITLGMRRGLLLAPILVSLGMGALFLDLGYKLHVFRFYLTFEPASPMSWGAWILVAVYPLQALLVLAAPTPGLERWRAALPREHWVRRLSSAAERQSENVARAALGAGAALGLYTGVLLSATVARPLWSSSVLALLFLVSGLSTAIAVLMLLESDEAVHRRLASFDAGIIGLELLILAMWLVGLSTQGPLYREAAALLLSGPYAPAFLGFVVFGGLVVPGALEILALRGRAMSSALVPLLVLGGGLVLRFVVVAAGQIVGFVNA